MNDRNHAAVITLSIAAVERDTGLSKDTLRVWERRYGFPTPGRDTLGERAYPLEQVEKLRGHVEGVVVGSALVEVLERGEDAAAFLRGLRAG